MALCGVSFLPARDALWISLPPLTSSRFPCSWRCSGSRVMRRRQATCSLRKIDSAAQSGAGKAAADEEIGPVMKFRMSDFAISSQVSVGLHGRADELIFEATVCDPNSPLYKSRVVLRQLTTAQAKRRGRRALEVLKKLARRKLMYHSYAMQVYGYVFSSDIGDNVPFTLVHGYHGSYSLRHWLQLSDWLPTLEVTLALDEECLRRVGDDTTGGPAVSRQHRLTRILMRDLLIAVNYLHSHGLAHTELRLENVHISPVDKHVKIPHFKQRWLIKATYYFLYPHTGCIAFSSQGFLGHIFLLTDHTRLLQTRAELLISLFEHGILGNAADFNNSNPNHNTNEVNNDRRKLMIAFDMRCVGFIMARLILKELMDASIFLKFKSFLTKGNDPSCLREFLLPILYRDSPLGNPGLQIMDRNWGAGWNLLSQLLALKPSKRISCLDALRHPFLCGPKWRTGPSMDLIRWGLGSTAVRMSEDYIYVGHQRSRIAYFIELMELLNPNPRTKGWLNFLPGRWRLLYSTGRHIGLTLRQTTPRVLIDDAYLTLRQASVSDHRSFSLISDISFKIIPTPHWPHDKSGPTGGLHVKSLVKLYPGRRHYPKEEDSEESRRFAFHNSASGHLSSRKWKGMDGLKELPSSLPAVKLTMDDIDVSMKLDSFSQSADTAKKVLQEVRTQIPFEMFDVSKFVCGTYVDSRMMVLRGVSGSALLFTRSCSANENV